MVPCIGMLTRASAALEQIAGQAGAFAAEQHRRRLREVDVVHRSRRRAARWRRCERRRGASRRSASRARGCGRPAGETRCPSTRASAFHPHGSADSSSSTTPVAPAAAAERMIAPALPGSCSRPRPARAPAPASAPTRTSTDGMRALATTPVGELTGESAFSTEPGHLDHAARPTRRKRSTTALSRRGRRTADRDRLDRDARVRGFAQQVPAVEQHQRTGAAREVAKLLDDGMLTAGDHALMVNCAAAGHDNYATVRCLSR